MKQEQIIKCGGQKIKVFNCDPEKNTQCDKEFCMHNINAIDGLCNHTTNPDFALEIGQKAQKKAYTPGRKNQRFNFDHGDRWVASTTPRKFAHDKKIKNRGWKYGAKKIGYIRKFNFSA